MLVKDIFLNLTKSTMPGGHEHLVEKYLPKGWKKDFHGNYYYQIGEPTIMFTSHCDTADNGNPKDVTHVIEGNIIKTDGKTILGADDKAGMAVMIYMIEKKKTGLYYFFLNEERGCVGSRALNKYLDTHKDDDLYKNITKVVSLDRKDQDNIITYQVSERCCSDEFADELGKRLNSAGGFNYRKDPTGSVTDSHQIAEKFSECTNLSVGYNGQHSTVEKQDIAFLQKLADACCQVDWETLPVKRDFTKVEYLHSSYSRNYNYGYGTTGSWNSRADDDRWWGSSSRSSRSSGSGTAYNDLKTTRTGPNSLARGTVHITDYLGNIIKVEDAQWCEYDKVWCSKKDAIWVDYVGFYTTPDIDPNYIQNKLKSGSANFELKDLAVGLELYKKSTKTGEEEKFGIIDSIDSDEVVIKTISGGMFILPQDKLLSFEFKIKPSSPNSASTGKNKLTTDNAKTDMIINHPIFGEGKILGITADKFIAKISFKEKGEKNIRIDMSNMTF